VLVFLIIIPAVLAVGCGGDSAGDSAPDITTPDTDPTPDTSTVEDTVTPPPDTATADVSPVDADPPALVCPPVEGPPLPPVEPMVVGVCGEQPLATPVEVLEAEVNGSAFVYTQPAEPKGLLLLFHGGGGNKMDILNRVEATLFMNDAIQMGLALASLDSEAHIQAPDGPKFKWHKDTTACNPDVVNVGAMVKRLMDPDDLAAVPPGTPLFALGGSNGGSIVSRAAQHMTFSAVASYISNAQSFHVDGAKIPPVFIMAGINDSTVGTTGPCLLAGLADDYEMHINWPEPVPSDLFTRIAGVDCALSQAIFTAFKDEGVLTAENMLANNPDSIQSWKPHLVPAAIPFMAEVRDLLQERYGEHAFTSDFNAEALEFLLSRAQPSTEADLPVCESAGAP